MNNSGADRGDHRSVKPLRMFSELKKCTLMGFRGINSGDFTLELCHNLLLEEVCLNVGSRFLPHKKLRVVLKFFYRCAVNLRKLTLEANEFFQYYVDAKALEIISSKIGKHSINLHCIDVTLAERRIHDYSNTQGIIISDKELQILGHNLAKNRKLKHLRIVIKDFQKITDKGIEDFAKEISRGLKDLHSLELSFKQCDFLTGSGLKPMAAEICKHMKNLKSLDLNIAVASVTADDLKTVSSYIKKELPGLKRLVLNSKTGGIFRLP